MPEFVKSTMLNSVERKILNWYVPFSGISVT